MSDKIENLKGAGKKGGTQFPKYSLKHLEQFLSSLNNKTYTNAITIEQLNAGVFGIGANSSSGKIKSSALKQFGLIEGDYKKFKATELCSKIVISEQNEKQKNFQESFNKVKIFTNTFNTFHNSKIEKSKISQYAVSTLKVHPELKEEFMKIFIESAEISGLCTVHGNIVSLLDLELVKNDGDILTDLEDAEFSDDEIQDVPDNTKSLSASSKTTGKISNINVNIDVDPSMDPEKLEKLLKLLKNYGAI